MGFDAWLTVAMVGAVFGMLIFTRLAPDVVMIGAVTVLLLSGVLTPDQALAGLSNQGMVTVGVLFVVTAGVQDTGAIAWLAERLFGRPKSVLGAITRLMAPTAFLSAWVNNTPLVAMLIPAVNDWAKVNRIAASKLMIPLSFASILGGCCTIIGTSTNLVVKGLVDDAGLQPLRLFDPAWVGVPAAIVGCAYVILGSRWLLPDRRPAMSELADPREYTVEMLVPPGSPLVGKTIEQANLRHLPGLFLAEINRAGFVLPAVSPREVLRPDDQLVFVGVVDSVVELQKIRGLVPATDQVFKLAAPRANRTLIEAVVSNTCPVVNRTIRDGQFRTRYNAVVIAVARNGERIKQKIGDIVLRAGDTLLLEATAAFADQHRNSRDFFLVSRLDQAPTPRHEKSLLSGLILLGMVATATIGENWGGPVAFDLGPWRIDLGTIGMLKAAMLAAGLMLVTRCCRLGSARRSIDWPVLLAIAASIPLAKALETTGAAKAITGAMFVSVGNDRWLSLALIYVVTLVATELITNNAAAALMFPFAMATAQQLECSYLPFVLAVMMGASLGFATPIGYQTNLMVYGPGGYRFTDYTRIGLPLDVLMAVVVVGLLPWAFPF